MRTTSVTTWTLTVPLGAGNNIFSVVGVNPSGQPVSGASNQVSVVYNGVIPSPVGAVVLNEIMANPMVPDAEYLELFNNATKSFRGRDCSATAYLFAVTLTGYWAFALGVIILWFAAKGEHEYPAAFAGAHGRGLTRLRLRLAAR